MIKYEWRSQLDPHESTELSELLTRAAVYDAEPEYNTIDFADIEQSMACSDPQFRHLVIWMLPHGTAMSEPDEPEHIAGVLRLHVDEDSTATATMVIDPRMRSIGIMTLLLEQVGLVTECEGGWCGTGARSIGSWARGNHPASGRLSDRFLIPRSRRIWKLIRATGAHPAAPVLEPVDRRTIEHLEWARPAAEAPTLYVLRESGPVGAVSIDLTPTSSDEFGRCATITSCAASPSAGADALRRLFDGAGAIANDSGLTGLIIYVDSQDTRLVHACRLAGFQHDRTDVLYQLGDPR
ncbi:hypothetical protein [Mycolicibacterium palauense]|uniref:hypothetical protein n=1 Tax=Mycolicibacterium palauense TaxID=2034511 RepID=UPI000BFED6C9|nr:hypothetical protein [Mycolicibacterium palauense]